MKTQGNTILVTGGGSGIGRALAQRWHDLGNTVIVAGRRKETLDETIARRSRMSAMTLDIDDPAAIDAFAVELLERHPDLNVLVNNAGIMRYENAASRRDLADAEETVVTNLLGPIRLICVKRSSPFSSSSSTISRVHLSATRPISSWTIASTLGSIAE